MTTNVAFMPYPTVTALASPLTTSTTTTPTSELAIQDVNPTFMPTSYVQLQPRKGGRGGRGGSSSGGKGAGGGGTGLGGEGGAGNRAAIGADGGGGRSSGIKVAPHWKLTLVLVGSVIVEAVLRRS